MPTHLYVSTDELKTYLGISGSGEDTRLAMLNKAATQMLNNLLSVSELSTHLVEDEVHDAVGKQLFALGDLHVRSIAEIMNDTTEYTQTDAYDIDNYLLKLENIVSGGLRKLLISYVAGWYPAGWTTITVTDYSAIVVGKKIAITPSGGSATNFTAGTDFSAATSNAVTATNIAAAINASTVAYAYVVGAVVTVIDLTAQRQNTAITYDGSGLTLGAATLNGAVDFPEPLRMAVCELVGGMRAKAKANGVRRYTIGSKTVEFATEQSFESFKASTNGYLRATVKAI